MRRRLLGLGLTAAGLGGACGSEGEWEDLVDHGAWEEADPAQQLDSYSGEAPPCAHHWVEDGLLEVDTEACPYTLLSQPLLRELLPGDTLRLGVMWETLTADARAEARLALTVGPAAEQVMLWEAHLPIPQGEGELVEEVTLQAGAPSGEELVLHVHNHGLNQYRWGRIRAR